MTTPFKQFSLGVDLAQSSFHAALAGLGQGLAAWKRLPNIAVEHRPDSPEGIAALTSWLRSLIDPSACLFVVVESTGAMSARFAAALLGQGLAGVSIVNPHWTRAFGQSLGQREKTDALDAAVLALYGAVHRPQATALPSEEEAALRELTRLREELVNDRTAWSNRRRQAQCGEARQIIEQTISHLEGQIEEMERRIEAAIDRVPQMRAQAEALRQIDGFGPVLATTVTAEFGDLTRYERNQLAGRAGAFPRRHESGQSVRMSPRMAKGGGARLRRVLYMAATALFRSNGPFRQWIDRKLKAGVKRMHIIGALMRKLLLVGRAVMKNGGVYNPELLFKKPRPKKTATTKGISLA